MARQQKQPTWSVRWRYTTRLSQSVVSTSMDKTENAMRNRSYCEVAVERAHMKSLDANDKLIQTRPHVRNTIASRKRQVIMGKGKSTIRFIKHLNRERCQKLLTATPKLSTCLTCSNCYVIIESKVVQLQSKHAL